jgi:lactobin A/cerein 7B family class IIb bacteriocin
METIDLTNSELTEINGGVLPAVALFLIGAAIGIAIGGIIYNL